MIEKECRVGSDITRHYASLVKLAKEDKKTYYFEANNIIFIADENSDEDLAKKYLNTAYTYGLKVIGPSEPMMTEEYKKNKEKENRVRQKEQEKRLKLERKEENKDKKYIEKMIRSEVFAIKEGMETTFNDWFDKNKKDSYSKVCFDYAIDLAKYLQTINSNGDYTEEDVKKGENFIRHYGISGFNMVVQRRY